jgi:hypothetical protein
MDVKKNLNTLGILMMIVGIVLQFLSPVKWQMLLTGAVLIVVSAWIVSKESTRKNSAIWSFISEAFSLVFCLWMLIDFIRNGEGHIYYPVLCLVFDLLAIGASVCMLLLSIQQKKGKEYNPLVRYLNKKFDV